MILVLLLDGTLELLAVPRGTDTMILALVLLADWLAAGAALLLASRYFCAFVMFCRCVIESETAAEKASGSWRAKGAALQIGSGTAS